MLYPAFQIVNKNFSVKYLLLEKPERLKGKQRHFAASIKNQVCIKKRAGETYSRISTQGQTQDLPLHFFCTFHL